MIVMGIDPSSSICGVTLLENKEAIYTGHWVRNKKKTLEQGVREFGEYLQRVKGKRKLSLVAIEEVGVNRNLNTVRKICYFESVGLMKAGEWNTPAFLVKTNTARKLALGKGTLTKKECYDILSSTIKLSAFDDGGSDESDSMVIALAGVAKFKDLYG